MEDNPDDHSVGYSGYPNLLGDVELDASIMNGSDRSAGAVGGLRGYRHAITVARAVLERLPHVLVTGEGAGELAAEIGLIPENTLTTSAERVWAEGRERQITQAGLDDAGLSDQVRALIGEIYDNQLARTILAELPEPGGTVNFLALDSHGNLASAVSTSGWIWKHPGRLGDSPLIGAGNYCDDRYGAVACTGWGELAIRAGAARMAVAGLAAGKDLADSCRDVLLDVLGLESGALAQRGHVSMVALDRSGHHHAASTKAGAQYVYRQDGMKRAKLRARTVIETAS